MIQTQVQTLRKLHVLLRETEKQFNIHLKGYGAPESSCETCSRLRGMISGIEAAIFVAVGGRLT